MYYITVRQSPSYHQISLEEFLDGAFEQSTMISANVANTRTYESDRISEKFSSSVDVDHLIQVLAAFNKRYESLRGVERSTLYHSFSIPKKSGGLRQIDAPLPELMDALRELKRIFEDEFHALYHTSAFAYVRNRSTIDAVKRHQANKSKWFLKLDAHNFFGSTTKGFIMHMMDMVFPFCLVVSTTRGRAEMETALELAFLRGVLPQGTPISPMLTNIMMIPIDYALSNGLREFNGNSFVYTRYADDMIISSEYSFLFRPVEAFVKETFARFNAPFTLNEDKTRYGSSAGRNWNLGIMLNKDNELTVGHKNKKQFQNMLSAYAKDKLAGIQWDLHDVQTMEGLRNYYRMVEGDTIDRIVQFVGGRFGVNIVREIRRDLRPN